MDRNVQENGTLVGLETRQYVSGPERNLWSQADEKNFCQQVRVDLTELQSQSKHFFVLKMSLCTTPHCVSVHDCPENVEVYTGKFVGELNVHWSSQPNQEGKICPVKNPSNIIFCSLLQRKVTPVTLLIDMPRVTSGTVIVMQTGTLVPQGKYRTSEAGDLPLYLVPIHSLQGTSLTRDRVRINVPFTTKLTHQMSTTM